MRQSSIPYAHGGAGNGGMPIASRTIVLQLGDTLWSLALRYHTTVPLLQSLNGLGGSTLIYAGADFRVPRSPQQPHHRQRERRGLVTMTAGRMALTWELVNSPCRGLTPYQMVCPALIVHGAHGIAGQAWERVDGSGRTGGIATAPQHEETTP
jgi:LysM repeat protein